MSDAISVLTDRKSLLSEDSLLERVIVAALQYYGARGDISTKKSSPYALGGT